MQPRLRIASDENTKPITRRFNFTVAALEAVKLTFPTNSERVDELSTSAEN